MYETKDKYKMYSVYEKQLINSEINLWEILDHNVVILSTV